MKLSVHCDDFIRSVLRPLKWQECIDEENLPKLEAILTAKKLPFETKRDGADLYIKVHWNT